MNRTLMVVCAVCLFAPVQASAQEHAPIAERPFLPTLLLTPDHLVNVSSSPQRSALYGGGTSLGYQDPAWVTALGLTLAVGGMGILGASQGYLGGALFDTTCFRSAGSVADAGFTGGVALGTSAIAVAVPISLLVRRRRGDSSPPAELESQGIGMRSILTAAGVTIGLGAAAGLMGGAISGGDNDDCGGRRHAARDAAFQLAVGGLFTWPLALMGP
jgi:hypothetical protein